MSRISGTVAQADLRHLLPAARDAHFEKIKDQCAKLYGPGAFAAITENNGDVSYTYDYDPSYSAPAATAARFLTDDELKAVAHAKVFVANSAQVKQNPDTGLYEALNEDALKSDPAMAGRIETLNILELLLLRTGQPA